jgi:HEAT repeats
MGSSSSFSADSGRPANDAPEQDPRLKPTPDWGTFGPGSDIGGWQPMPQRKPVVRRKPGAAIGPVLAAVAAMFAGMLFVKAHADHPAGGGLAELLFPKPPRITSAHDAQLDHMKAQNQAEALLELAVANSDGAVEQISARVDTWHGRVRWNSQIANLSAAALNSKDLRVRESGVEVELAAYGLSKNSASFNYLLKTADSADHANKIWALWALGLMGNRGVQADQVVQVLTMHLQDGDADSRRWAVEGLALTGADGAIQPLLTAMHNDPVSEVRGRAACGIAEAGLFTHEQRMSAVPTLLNYSDDPELDAQTRGWAFHALSDITHQRLPNNTAAWRGWYEAESGRD